MTRDNDQQGLRYEDERYVRLYTRETAQQAMRSWDARALLHELMKRVDRAGLLPLPSRNRANALAALVRCPDVARAASALDELIEDGTVVFRGNVLVLPKFLEAQECLITDKARKRAERERARDKIRAASMGAIRAGENPSTSPESVQPGHELSRGVQVRPEESQQVTLNRSDPRQDDPRQEQKYVDEAPSEPSDPDGSCAFSEEPIEPPQASQEGLAEPSPLPHAPPDDETPATGAQSVAEVLEHWASKLYPTRKPKFDRNRKGKVRARLAEGWSVEDLKRAVDGCASSKWHVDGGHKDIELICRDTPHVERFIALLAAPRDDPPARPRPDPGPQYPEYIPDGRKVDPDAAAKIAGIIQLALTPPPPGAPPAPRPHAR